jgi:hypothetical protein
MKAARSKLFGVPRSDEDQHSAGGLGNHLDQMNAWLDMNCGVEGERHRAVP